MSFDNRDLLADARAQAHDLYARGFRRSSGIMEALADRLEAAEREVAEQHEYRHDDLAEGRRVCWSTWWSPKAPERIELEEDACAVCRRVMRRLGTA